MEYQWHYDNLIKTRKDRVKNDGVYYERHHILMKSMGGTNDKENLVFLTAREHFLAHWLLWKIHRNQKSAFAFFCMTQFKNIKRYTSSRGYAEAKEARMKIKVSAETLKKMSNATKGKNNPMFGKKGVLSPLYGLGKSVFQYTKDGILINKWKSSRIIMDELNFGVRANGAISSCCNLKSKTYKKFIWSFKELTKCEIDKILLKEERPQEYKNLIKQHTTKYWNDKTRSGNRTKHIIQYTLNGEFLKEWNSAKEMKAELGFNREQIYHCCNDKQKTSHGFIWKWGGVEK